MWNVPNKERLERIPRLYETEKIPLQEKIVHLHFFIFGCDWYVIEGRGDDVFWGFAVLNDDLEMAEFGYFSFQEMKDINIRGIEIDCELEEHFPPRKASEIPRICEANGWRKEAVNG
jgi:hypothetical protein